MGITSFSSVVQPSRYVEPISEDLMMKGTMMDAQRIDQADQDIQNTYNSLIGDIPSLPGADTERKKEIMSGIQEQVKGLSYNDLRSPSATKQIKNYIQQVSNNPDLLVIASRGQKYNQDLSTYQALTAKGKQVSPWNMQPIEQAQKYMEANQFDPKLTFSGNVQEDPEIYNGISKAMGDVREEENTNIVGGQYITTKTKPKDKLNAAGLGFIENNPQVKEDFQRRFDYQTKGADWNTLGQQHYQQGLDAANYVLTNPHASSVDKQSALKDKQQFESALQSSNLGNMYKQEASNRQIGTYVDNLSSGLNSFGRVHKQTEVAINAQNKALDYQYDMAKEIRDLQTKSGLAPKDYYVNGAFNRDAYVKDAQEKVQQDQLDLTQGKQDIKDASKGESLDNAEKSVQNSINRLELGSGLNAVTGETDATSLAQSNYAEFNKYLKSIEKSGLAGDDYGNDIESITNSGGKILVTGDFEGVSKTVELEQKEFANFLKTLNNKGNAQTTTIPQNDRGTRNSTNNETIDF